MLIGVDASRITRPHRTGTENYSLNVLRHLLELDKVDDYRLYLSAALPPDLLPQRSYETRLIRLPRLWTQLGLSREMLTAPPDVLFVPSHVLPLITPSRSVVVVYDVGHRFFPRAHGIFEWLYLEWAIRRHVKLATALLTISEASKRDVARLYGADPARIAVAYPAVDERFAAQPPHAVAAMRERLGLQEPYVLHLGTLKPRKNLPRLIRAFAQADLPPETQLVLGGMTTSGGAAVERVIQDLDLGSRVRRLAYVPDAELPALYAGASVVAIVSVYEGFGMPALEALACGAPLLAGNRGSLPEIVGDSGIIVDSLDVRSIRAGLERAWAEGPRLRASGPPRARAFRWREAARVTLDVLLRAGQPGAGTRLPYPPPSAAN